MNEPNSGITVLPFDYSVENHFKAMNTIHKLCLTNETEQENDDGTQILQHFNSHVTFLREWMQYNNYYKPRVVKFSCQVNGKRGNEVVTNEVDLPQFSSATVPKIESSSGETSFPATRKDFVLYVGGHVWALDWCGSVYQQSDSHIKCEYLAVAAHPPETSSESSYHKIGMPLTGRGVVQIWCLLHEVKEEVLPPIPKKQCGRPRMQVRKVEPLGTLEAENQDQALSVQLDDAKAKDMLPLKRPRGRPRKHDRKESIDDSNGENQMVQATGGQFDIAKEESVPLRKTRGRPRKQKKIEESFANLGKECHFVPPLAVDVSLESLCSLGSENLGQALAVQLDNAEEKDVVTFRRSRGRTRIKSLDDSNRENQMFQATGQIDHPKDKESLPLRKASERIRKKREIKEFLLRLDTESQFVPPLAFDICQDPLGALGGESQGQAPAAQLVNANEKDTHPFRRPRGRPGKKTRCKSKSVQGADGQLDNVKEKDSLPLNKAKGRLRKQKDIKEGLLVDTESQVVPPLAVDISQEALDNMKEKDSLPLKKAEGGLRKKKDIKGGLLVDTESQFVPPLVVGISQEASGFLALTEATRSTEEQAMVESWDTDVGLETQALDQCRYKLTKLKRKKKDKTLRVTHHVTTSSLTLAQDKDMDTSFDVLHGNKGFDQDAVASSLKVANNGSLEISSNSFNPPKDVALPRVVLCLAHNGKVAWDVKWRPPNVCDVENKHRMGYLAVVLGNGSLEVWEVPLPRAIEVLFSSCKKEGTDPRFVKLEPVFRCSKLISGDRHSIPLTVEWSTSSPHDLLLAGCHDGTVGLWKFSASGSSQDTRPLLCFSADTFPIRALAWAPNESDEESANIVVTAGHGGGLRFWDIRDPYRPLWDLSSVHRFIYSLDWLPDPRCVIIAFDDGALRILSFSEAAYDVAVTGKPFGGTPHQGLHSYFCSSFPIWSVQVSRLTGQVAYCSSDGLAIRFQLTSKAVNKYRSSNRAPHFLCGSLTEEDAALIVNTPLLNIHLPTKKSVPMNKSVNKCGPISKQAKGAKDQAPDNEPLDLCFDDDTLEFGVEDTVSSSKGKNTTKKSKKMMKSNEEEAQTDNESPDMGLEDCVTGEGKVTSKMSKKNTWKNEEGAQTEIGVFPPKIVAMHRVRWNMNKGSERWLCYGGAAGVVRCQEIFASSTRECSLVKAFLSKKGVDISVG